jgi:hypothetical protein
MVGVSLLSFKFYLEVLRGFLRRRGGRIKIKLKMHAISLPKGFTLMLIISIYIAFYPYIVFFSPTKDAVLAAERNVRENDLIAIKDIDKIVPKDSKVLMYSLPETIDFYQQWSYYPVNIYIGRANISTISVDYVVISPWCYTTSAFVGKQYFDQNANLTLLYELSVERGSQAAYTGFYAVYKVLR